jgi:glycosyltransferase involved in cell wall biosynthesis
MTSRVEACPNTLLEAMSHGCFCISTTSAPMPEFLGEAALYYSPGSGVALAGQLSQLSTLSTGDIARFRDGARARAQEFTWERTAERTVSVLEEVATRCARR